MLQLRKKAFNQGLELQENPFNEDSQIFVFDHQLLKQKEPQMKELNKEKEVKKRLLIDSNLNTLKGLKILLDNMIIMLILTSAISKMNAYSMIYFMLVCLHLWTNKAIKITMNTVSFLLFLRLILIWSNVDQNISGMSYPQQFQN